MADVNSCVLHRRRCRMRSLWVLFAVRWYVGLLVWVLVAVCVVSRLLGCLVRWLVVFVSVWFDWVWLGSFCWLAGWLALLRLSCLLLLALA